MSYAGSFLHWIIMRVSSPHYNLSTEPTWEREENQLKIKYLCMSAEFSTTANLISFFLKLIYFLRIFLSHLPKSPAYHARVPRPMLALVFVQNLNIVGRVLPTNERDGFQTKNYAEMIISEAVKSLWSFFQLPRMLAHEMTNNVHWSKTDLVERENSSTFRIFTCAPTLFDVLRRREK